ncbi:sensor histidine kinase [Jeotgalibacillus terrae]|uniref:histidine kinase n=1 Tax=Jeotgalibacillus terrae TaxID=587735 RepID=A0ABW5ZKC1_9BACL|nr:HAMP domain-containing sensor histidine kinase [Jeotgalibacillus terrae]MBM7578136.1 signal transduction histidine kinase [Jeotgalibacillus terrae]
MNIHRRFTIQLFIQLMLIFFLVASLIILSAAITGFAIKNDEMKNDLSLAESYFISENITISDESADFDAGLQELVKDQKGWLMVVSSDGEIMGNFRTPTSILSHLNQNGFSGLLVNNQAFDYTYWQLDEADAKSPVVIFGKENVATGLLAQAKEQIDWENSQLDFSDDTSKLLTENSGFVQLLDQSGNVINQYQAEDKPPSYSIEQILSLNQSKTDSIQAYHDETTNQTLLVGVPKQQSGPAAADQFQSPFENSFLIIFILLFLLLLGSTFWYAHKFGSPLLHMLKWIDQLSQGNYQQPLNHLQEPALYKRNGKLKKKYRLYKDLIMNLSHLTDTLKENEEQRGKIKLTREEWISGISHDLKTPLASISGYAKMIEAQEYSWTPEETRAFAGTISSKATYMKDLLEDLTLTYRIKNGALPINPEQTDVDELLRTTIISFMNNSNYNDKILQYKSEDHNIQATIDPKWFQRIMDNLIENALRYNPSGTTVTVSLAKIEDQLLQITIADNGIGMDQHTINQLFNRYFRGTNTSDSGSGTGLGMTITKQLVQLHKGSINVKSRPGEGTVFRVLVPVRQFGGEDEKSA